MPIAPGGFRTCYSKHRLQGYKKKRRGTYPAALAPAGSTPSRQEHCRIRPCPPSMRSVIETQDGPQLHGNATCRLARRLPGTRLALRGLRGPARTAVSPAATARPLRGRHLAHPAFQSASEAALPKRAPIRETRPWHGLQCGDLGASLGAVLGANLSARPDGRIVPKGIALAETGTCREIWKYPRVSLEAEAPGVSPVELAQDRAARGAFWAICQEPPASRPRSPRVSPALQADLLKTQHRQQEPTNATAANNSNRSLPQAASGGPAPGRRGARVSS